MVKRFSCHNQPNQYTGKGPVRQWDSVFIQCPSPYAVHLRVGNLHVKIFFPCAIYLHFHNSPQNLKNGSQTNVTNSTAPPQKLLLRSRESAKHCDSASPVSAGAAKESLCKGTNVPTAGQGSKVHKAAWCCQHPLLLDTKEATPPLKKPMDWFWPPSTTAPPRVRHPQ